MRYRLITLETETNNQNHPIYVAGFASKAIAIATAIALHLVCVDCFTGEYLFKG